MQRDQILNRLKQELANQVPSKKINIPEDLKLLKIHSLRRDLEDDEELLQRDFDAEFEEFFEREYDDFLAERDAFDGFHPLRRDLEDDEELLRRDFDAEFEEFFEREYDDFLAERDAFDDDLDYY